MIALPCGLVAILYKGAGPGTFWALNDPRLGAGFVSASAAPPSVPSMVRHITAFSHPSPYLSLTASFAVAYAYALGGPAGAASSAMPGYVYEIDTGVFPVKLIDPVSEVASATSIATAPRLLTHHDGGQDLILGIAAPSLHAGVLLVPPKRPGATLPNPPAITPELHAVVFSLRDAEMLAEGPIPPGCIVHRHNVP